MICDKCGKNNLSDMPLCSYCGAEIPKISECSGFADILNFERVGIDPPSSTSVGDRNEKEKISDFYVQKLLKKTDFIMKSTKKNVLFCMITMGLGVLILISSVIIGAVTIGSIKEYKDETLKQLEENQKEVVGYRAQIDALLNNNGDAKTDSGNDAVSESASQLTDVDENENN